MTLKNLIMLIWLENKKEEWRQNFPSDGLSHFKGYFDFEALNSSCIFLDHRTTTSSVEFWIKNWIIMMVMTVSFTIVLYSMSAIAWLYPRCFKCCCLFNRQITPWCWSEETKLSRVAGPRCPASVKIKAQIWLILGPCLFTVPICLQRGFMALSLTVGITYCSFLGFSVS